jgi:hypothetical protein
MPRCKVQAILRNVEKRLPVKKPAEAGFVTGPESDQF